MKRTLVLAVVVGLVVAPLVSPIWPGRVLTSELRAAEAAAATDTAPVESDMHEFMEYVFQPTYIRLQMQMASAPADNKGWKAIKSDALILAEGGNLLIGRPSDEEGADWLQHSAQVREAGGHLYRAAKSKDFEAARQQYEAMLQHCNACHQQFAGGEHMLKP